MSLSCEFNKQQLIENIQVRCAIQCNITRQHQSAKGEHSRILEEIHLFKWAESSKADLISGRIYDITSSGAPQQQHTQGQMWAHAMLVG